MAEAFFLSVRVRPEVMGVEGLCSFLDELQLQLGVARSKQDVVGLKEYYAVSLFYLRQKDQDRANKYVSWLREYNERKE